mmetsp:Transcript_11512/g.35163  ORF Transcript_11512/g.35163 Transcript_11512/m.35163 type:complete len:124 (+) Transcript_11512:631-1002(+)
MERAIKRGAIAPHSESAWNFIRSLAALAGVPLHKVANLVPILEALCPTLGALPSAVECSNVPVTSLYIDVLQAQDTPESQAARENILRSLRTKDEIRSLYWTKLLEEHLRLLHRAGSGSREQA